jgi:transposase
MKKQCLKPVFKRYNQSQMMLLPPSLDELIEENHPVRIVDHVLENVDDSVLKEIFSGPDIVRAFFIYI